MPKYLSISKMAKIHNISRQTLIYYDKIDLFKPTQVDENGYRYYSPSQIPFLREVCFLKSVGVKLKDIKTHIKNRNLNSAISLLEYHKKFIDKNIEELLCIRNSINSRLNVYSTANKYKEELYHPIIETFPERQAAFFPLKDEITRSQLHLTLMKEWNILVAQGVLPSCGFGTIILSDSIPKENIFSGAGAFIFLPAKNIKIKNTITLPAGQYACMYKYGMPYNTKFLFHLLEWISSNNYKICGNIIDACLLDNTFYAENSETELCQLQIPVEKI